MRIEPFQFTKYLPIEKLASLFVMASRLCAPESELEKVLVDGGKSPAPSWRVQ
jgi:hypothetical protein